ncbi:MAG: sulfur carrier protein ThiS [Rikenellaceae bacterium]
MKVTVNDREVEFEGKTLADLLRHINFGDGGNAIAVGNFIIERSKREEYHLKEGDIITIIVATHGG